MYQKTLAKIDAFLNGTTMYRLVLYYLVVLWVIGLLFAVFNILPLSPLLMLVSLPVLVTVSWGANTLFAKVYGAQTNVESLYITAFILALIISPLRNMNMVAYFAFLFWAAAWAMAAKYILAIGKKHIFNPAAFAVALTSFTIGESASWWVGSGAMFAFVLIGGLLLVKKLRRSDLVFSFIFVALALTIALAISSGIGPISAAAKAIFNSPLLFFAFVMLTEPLTTPSTNNLQMLYGGITGFLIVPQVHLGSLFFTPELTLLAGNVFSYLVSPKQKLVLKLKEKIEIAKNTYHFVFQPIGKLAYEPGQYMEWTLGHVKPDTRGNRRYFTLASSPTESELALGVKFYPQPSSFKNQMLAMQPGQEIIAAQLAGDFTLPRNINQKLVFMAGGIGVTPFRSMLKYLLDNNERRDVVVFYANGEDAEVCYREIFDSAQLKLGIKTVYALTKQELAAQNLPCCHLGRVDSELIKKHVPDYLERIFYLSGPHAMVTAYENILKQMGVKGSQIKTDFFPGFA